MIEGGIEGIEIPAVQLFLSQAQELAESLVMDQFPLSQEADRLANIVVLNHPENVVVGGAGFLLWRDLVKTTYKNTRKNR